ncbi:ribonuclease HII [Spiroplasma turonicum]|uniref:Ribonuclease HII n=1 Tax=Spiroplasma turonicum TaxID=216946 RepID=A0A0K1P797_9MOLU|nr:ribonuclease HII [Spiroplasma turonicum]AKU80069.1 phosphoglucomutase/phosphomannomutase [Spiroplasma turonicum]ALX71071.1 phosphoglucomutase/phosphomannomutase [Spiroplasma turonicum]
MINNSRFLFDKNIKEINNVELISGSDEVGRGAMAGPIVVASVILKPNYFNPLIKDSKLLNEKQRESLYEEIINNCITFAICEYNEKVVDELNPKKTSQLGMVDSIKKLRVKPELCLIDGEDIYIENYKFLKIIKGDNLSLSIACASIIAKVYRDRIMNMYHTSFPNYNFIKNKGYCTKKHIEALQSYGILDIHRLSYKPVYLVKEKLMNFNKQNELYKEWMNSKTISEELKNQLINYNNEQLKVAFENKLEFGTAGVRGILGAGPGHFNEYTIKEVTIGYARYLLKKYPQDLSRGVVIGHDNRKFSKEFAKLVAEILTSFSIKAYLFENNEMKPTPVVSFATRKLNAIGGIVITASHNPAEYNGYKIYDENGCQLIDSDTLIISKYISDIENILDWNYKVDLELIYTVDKSILNEYCLMINNLQFYKEQDRNNFKIIYSAVNGTGSEFSPKLLRENGYEVIEVEEHSFEDSTFKNVGNPNPEFEPAWKYPYKYAEKNKDASLIIIQDPDADRIGIAVNHNGNWVRIDGNQTGPILIEWKLSQMKLSNTMPKNPALYSSFVTSDLGDRIASEGYDVKIVKTLTGFKWMGSEILKEKERDLNFVFAYEESYGYVIDSSTRDKDGIQAAMMLTEAAWYYKNKYNKTLIDVLNDLYEKYGYYYTHTINLNFSITEIKSKVEPLMKKLRYDNIEKIGDLDVMFVEDYLNGLYNMPGQNLLKFYFTDKSWFAVRPSGTEPKIKLYFVCVDSSLDNAKNKCENLIQNLKTILSI